MVVKIYVSGISGNKEVKKRQQRVLMILDSKNIKYEIIDITEPGKEGDKDFMQNNSKSNGGTVSDPNPRHALPPQLFNEEEYCGDYDQFDLANEVDTLEQFLKVEVPPENNIEEQKQATTQENNVEEQKEDNNQGEKEKKAGENNVEPEKEKLEEGKANIESAANDSIDKIVHMSDSKNEEAASKESTEEVDDEKKIDSDESKIIEVDSKDVSTGAAQENKAEKSEECVKSEQKEEVVQEKNENNGVTSSREPSIEKKVEIPVKTALESSKDTEKSPSENLIESEKATSE